MITLPNELDAINEKKMYHKDLVEIHEGQIKCLKENIESAEQHAKQTETALGIGYWNLREQLAHTKEKLKAQQKVIKVWEDRIVTWEEKFEKDSKDANTDLENLLNRCKTLGMFYPTILTGLQNLSNHNLNDQHTKNECYIMLRNEFVRGLGVVLNSDKANKLSSENRSLAKKIIGDVKLSVEEKYQQIITKLWPNLKIIS